MHRDVPYAVTELLQGETLAERLRVGAARRAARDRDRLPDRRRARGGARDGRDPSGHQAREHLPDQRRPGEDPRLRHRAHREPGRARRPRARSSRDVELRLRHGHRRVHLARAGARQACRRAQRHLRPRRRLLRDARRASAPSSRDSPVETLGAVLRDDPRKHPEVKKIPEALAGYVFRCLEKDPADRYQSARDLVMDLRAWQAGAIEDAATRVKFQSVPPWRQRKTRMVLRGSGRRRCCSSLGFYAGSCWQRERVRDRRAASLRPRAPRRTRTAPSRLAPTTGSGPGPARPSASGSGPCSRGRRRRRRGCGAGRGS